MKLTTVQLSSGKKGTQVESNLFDVTGHATLVSQAVRVYLANQRGGTAKTKTRGEVNRTKKKWYKQKGTGNARHGARSAPIFVGGGVTHGPHGDTNWKLSMSKTMRTRALQTALNMQALKGIVSIVEGVDALTGKTKEMIAGLNKIGILDKAVLLIVDGVTEQLLRATQNIENILVCNAKDINTYVIARAQSILITPEGLQALHARLDSVSSTKEDSVVQEVVQEEKPKKPRAKAKKAVAKAE